MDRPTRAARPARDRDSLASPRAVGYARALIHNRDRARLSRADRDRLDELVAATSVARPRAADVSAVIDILKPLPARLPAGAGECEEAVYLVDGVVYRTRHGRRGLYADRLVLIGGRPGAPYEGGRWEYAAGAARRLAAADRLDVAEAAAWGRRTHVCVCGRALLAPGDGVHPACARRL
ncbi:hypothetical protein [Bailinhaonella thermotolerans]|uniref:Uncharacterized protein n=1 Tax=Bailinhaonella thermotolerans TaxID=1070861 RepID=A0A3A4A484_9ACTN|nr:hypothetical protein [Bailinhaonella thermotolerans]RJL19726.1 hypothetical protein D5H75_40075 [Bailinhaonella thermotolerans]